MLKRVAQENPLRLNVGRAPVPQGAFGSIVRTNGVIIRVNGNSPRELGYSYEQGIRDTFGSGKSEGSFIAQIGRTVDDVFEEQVLEAKHIKVYMESIYNPRSADPWQRPALDALVKQAREITRAYDGGAIYFTNDEQFARDYTEIFQQNGISKFRFVIAPSSADETTR